jgi:hypothetical protein
MMGGYGGMGGMNTPERKGVDKRGVDRGKKKEEEIKAVESSKGLSLFDPYFDIWEVKIYGQARFYSPPPEGPAGETSPGETAADASKTEPAAGEAAKAEPAKTETAKAEPAKSEAEKTEPAKTEPAKTEPAKTEAAKGADVKAANPKS